LFIDAVEVPAQYHHLQTRLRIEQVRFLSWGRQTGLVRETFEKPSQQLQWNRNLVLDVLCEIRNAFFQCQKIEAKYLMFASDADVANPSITLRERMLAIAEEVARVPSRLRWASIKKDQFESLISKVIQYNDKIESFLDRSTLDEIQSTQMRSNLLLLRITHKIDELQALVEAMHVPRVDPGPTFTSASSPDGACSFTGPAVLLAELAAFKVRDLLETSKSISTSPLWLPMNSVASSASTADCSRAMTKYEDKPAWLEWRESIDIDEFNLEIRARVQRRVEKLVSLLSDPQKPKQFRAPLCLGYVRDDTHEPARYGLLYTASFKHKDGTPKIKSLRQLLSGVFMPSLTKRLSLARAIVESLLYLHAVEWLHKGMRSDSILFVGEENNDSRDVDLSDPILSGFDYSRPDLVDELSFSNINSLREELYHHPELLQSTAKKAERYHDIYSLGLVLVEIALWKPIEEVVEIEVRKSMLLEVSRKLQNMDLTTDAIGATLVAHVGETFVEAIQCCIQGRVVDLAHQLPEQASDDSLEPTFHSSILDVVIHKLQSLRI